MTAKKSKKSNFFRKNWVYFLGLALVFALAFFGSRDKSLDSDGSMSLQAIASNNYSVSADQVSEFYVVAELANSMELFSSNDVANNYVSVSVLQQNSQVLDTSGKLSKPIIVDVGNLSRGVVSYTVQPGDTMESIAAKYGITTDQIRWSNNLSNTTISEGRQLLIPSVPGIVYTVKDGDTVESLASKYNSNIDQIISLNDLEVGRNLSAGMAIILPSGSLPETERPEYVAPATSSSYSNYSYSYYTYSGSGRENVQVVDRWTYARSMLGDGNPMMPGQCTWYAWYYRQHVGGTPLGKFFGNANAWASVLASRFRVDRNPSVHAVFQTSSGYYGHVGVVTAVNGDGSITVREMNYAGAYVVTEARIPASQVHNYYYIH
ncbi:LysM peptidoglycan-binding domain-containing protein [Candidatus Saccharibacteria bacterium]|nr:LysM peptidoglycan-binding domain-containing protein [Candidatus Saccharibacteria bacterium]